MLNLTACATSNHQLQVTRLTIGKSPNYLSFYF
ncbi:hypothetical protein HD_0323 [[Haemophilus] ducreyi 35000HP]|uniref:Uncharacterized protein n=1 Tax=Haemophilus ducreyi (strain 35000HP / ATCC 700724) TaxID=233412 RepID=Q7VNZ2_HAEDU|nr:hypothetical protein HD_0323 [[Haemophilus] ducreyi 35000HP]